MKFEIKNRLCKVSFGCLGSDQCGSSINPSVVNTDDNKCLSDQSLFSEPVRVSNRIGRSDIRLCYYHIINYYQIIIIF